MNPDASIDAAIRRLFGRTTHGIRPGLAVVTGLLARMGNPHHGWLAVHVAGTNGKGSVCAMIESVLRAAGLRTGLYTSPHLVRFHERLRVQGRPVGDAGLAALFEAAERETAAMEAGGSRAASFFEITTAMAFEHFRREGVQVGVIETGMGGRWDATNVVRPVLSVLCDVDIDHTEYLGCDLQAITEEKCGVIKAGRPVVCGALNPGVVARVREVARAGGSPLVLAGEAVSVRRLDGDFSGQRLRIEGASISLPPVRLPLAGAHQLRNAAAAVAALELFAETAGVAIGPGAFCAGLESLCWPARLQLLEREPAVLLDCAHNPHAARALADALAGLAKGRPVGLVAGMLADKDAAGYARVLAPRVARAWTVGIGGERGRTAPDLAAVFAAAGIAAEPFELDRAWDEGREWARRENGLLLVAGSLYLAGEVLRRYASGDRLFEEEAPPP